MEMVKINLEIMIPRHYHEFHECLKESYNFDSGNLATLASDGIIMGLNAIEEAGRAGFNEITPIIKPELSDGSRRFKA